MDASVSGFSVSGRDLPELFQNAALAVVALLVDPATVSPGGLRDRLRAEGPDVEELLLRWLELVRVQVTVNQMIPAVVRVLALREAPHPAFVEAELDGELLDPHRHKVPPPPHVKKIRGAEIISAAGGWLARVSFDV